MDYTSDHFFDGRDAILEPQVFQELAKFVEAGGAPEVAVEKLSSSYQGTAQLVNLVASWLVDLGSDPGSVQSVMEDHLSRLIARHFDPKKADSIFHQQSENQIEWLPDFISCPPWRTLIYKLSEEHSDCLMLNFAIKLISDAGYQQEIYSVNSAAQQLEIFSRVLCTAIDRVLSQAPGTPSYELAVDDLAKVVSRSEHAYLYTQSLIQALLQDAPAKTALAIRRIGQELRVRAEDASKNTTAFTLALYNSTGAPPHPEIIGALYSMLSRQALNPADMHTLYEFYMSNDPPPVHLIRDHNFMNLLIDALFRPETRLNPEYKSQYVYLLSYSASVSETYKKGQRKQHNRGDLKQTQAAIEKVHAVCSSKEAAVELLAELNTFFQCIRYPIVALGVLHWVKCTVLDPNYFKLHTEPTPLHLALVDEIVNYHQLLYSKVFALIVDLFEMEFDGVDVLTLLELRKMLIERLVHLFSKGYVLPVVAYIRNKSESDETDMSLIRYFVTETLEIITPPYTVEFQEAFVPLLTAQAAESLPEDKMDAVKQFLMQCKS